jgi:hypothetical protein
VTSIGGSAPSPFDDRQAITRTLDSNAAETNAILRAINDNIIASNPANRAGGGGGGFSGDIRGIFDAYQVRNF